MDRGRFLADLARQRAWWEKSSPLNDSILAAIEAAAGPREPPWWPRLSTAWAGREFRTWYEAPALLVDALHYAALLGEEPGLRALFPTCGGDAAGAAAGAVDYLASAPDSFWARLRVLRLQTNDVSRAQGWLLAACGAFRTRDTPFHLADLGTSGGLNLVGDYLPRSWTLEATDGAAGVEPPGWKDRPFPVLSRQGLDGRPRRLSEPADRLWLKACIPADASGAHARFEAATGMFLALERETAGPRLLECDFPDMPRLVARRLRPHPDEGLLFYSSQATDFLTDAQYRALREGVAEALLPWEDRGFWAEFELPRDGSVESHRLTVHRLIDGRLEGRVLAEAAGPDRIRLLPGWESLKPLKPVLPQRNTREESPVQLEPGLVRFPFSPRGDP